MKSLAEYAPGGHPDAASPRPVFSHPHGPQTVRARWRQQNVYCTTLYAYVLGYVSTLYVIISSSMSIAE